VAFRISQGRLESYSSIDGKELGPDLKAISVAAGSAPPKKMSGVALREAERLKDLRRWLERHTSNPELPRRHSEYYKNEQILKHLLRGTDSEENPLREAETLLHFAAQRSLNGHQNRSNRSNSSKYLHKSHKFTSAIERLENYDKEGRWNCGLNAVTILTEYRRKIIFHAMLDTKDVNEDRTIAREKLDAYLASYAPELLEATEKTGPVPVLEPEQGLGATPGQRAIGTATPLSLLNRAPIKPIEYSSNSTTASDKRRKTTSKTSKPVAYEPKWGEFDVMRNRWRYIKPQCQMFRSDDEMIVPSSPEKLVKIANTHSFRGTVTEGLDLQKRLLQKQYLNSNNTKLSK